MNSNDIVNSVTNKDGKAHIAASVVDDSDGWGDDFILEDPAEEELWDMLMTQIIDGNVIPVIGADLLTDHQCNPHKLIINKLAKEFAKKSGVSKEINSFQELYSQYLRDADKSPDHMYHEVTQLLNARRFTPSERLRRFLSVAQFPFVITTSFAPVVEDAMRNIWGNELSVKIFSNNPAQNDDICDDADLRKPTVYYMFGKVTPSARKYVLTDLDLLDFVSSWLSENRQPQNLCKTLKNKYLLVLGNNYSDWLFRFIWYSMRKESLDKGLLAYDTLDQSLIDFLETSGTFVKQNSSDVIDQILTRLECKMKEIEECKMKDDEKSKFEKPKDGMDVFISYSRSDLKIVEELYNQLTAQGKRVWFDKYDINKGGMWESEIRRAIKTARYFIPIFTHNIEKEKNERHYYRNEWHEAIDVAKSLGREYLIPVAENGFDFYRSAIPDTMQKHNAIFYTDEAGIKEAVSQIIQVMNKY